MRVTRLGPIVALSVSLLVTSSAARAADQAPFRGGEIVLAGSPAALPGSYDVVKYLPNADLTVVRVAGGTERAAVAAARAGGLRAALNRIVRASATPNDPFFNLQWHFDNVQAQQAWDLTDGFGVTVAVLDSGLATGGPDGIGCVVGGRDIVNDDGDPADGDGHGTHVSGTVAQATDNNTGVAGLAHGACVMPVKVLDDNGNGSMADIADGIYHAVANGAAVINMSLGTDARFGVRNDPFVDPALDHAHASGVTVVCAAGNEANRRNVGYPAIYPTTIAVGATDFLNGVPRYSNKGDGLDMVAPGGDVTKDRNGDGYADGVLQETHDGGAWGYYFFQGTSMSSPHVAAAAAMVIAADVATTPDDVREALTSTALDLDDPGYDSKTGWGLLQVHAALSWGPCVDADADGFCAADDCDDLDAAVNPDAAENCSNGIDDDCDGQVDGDDAECGGCVPSQEVVNGVDDDCDGLVDCDNPDVSTQNERGPRGRDGLDNDCNGIIDG